MSERPKRDDRESGEREQDVENRDEDLKDLGVTPDDADAVTGGSHSIVSPRDPQQ